MRQEGHGQQLDEVLVEHSGIGQEGGCLAGAYGEVLAQSGGSSPAGAAARWPPPVEGNGLASRAAARDRSGSPLPFSPAGSSNPPGPAHSGARTKDRGIKAKIRLELGRDLSLLLGSQTH